MLLLLYWPTQRLAAAAPTAGTGSASFVAALGGASLTSGRSSAGVGSEDLAAVTILTPKSNVST